MTIFFIIVFTILIIALFAVIIILIRQTKIEKREKISEEIKTLLDKNEFVAKKIFTISEELTLAINKKENKLGIIKTNILNETDNRKFYLVSSNMVTSIYKTSYGINLEYIYKTKKYTININSKDKEIEQLAHNFFKNACIKKLQEKYNVNSFKLCATSGWDCEYVWAFRPMRTMFAYYKTTEKKAIYKINLLKEFFTIDVKFEYFEAPVLGRAQQLSVYENSFLNDLFLSLSYIIKQKCSNVYDNKIYYDSYNDIVYLTNGITTLQSIILKDVKEVFYKEDRLTFVLNDNEKIINFRADRYILEEFENFIISYNLRKIATSFDYKIDKLINTTEGTKFIVDASRDRIVYCAGLNSLSRFTYMTILFSNLEKATLEKSKDGYFVRIFTKDKDILDVSCKKTSVAQYIMAQITTIVNL